MMKTNAKRKNSAVKKLIPAAGMLALSASMLATSTYAWFTMNKSVTVTGMELKTTVSSNLQIAATNSESAFDNSLTQSVKALLEPVSTIDGLNTASGLTLNNVHNITLNNLTFIECAQGSGVKRGAIQITGTNTYDIKITNCHFITVSSGWGSAIYVDHNSQSVHALYIINCTVENSKVTAAAAIEIGHNIISGHDAYYKAPYDNHIVGCTFIDCFANNAGAIEIMSKDSSIEDCHFINCNAANGPVRESIGGAILFYRSALNNIVDGCTFIDCLSDRGGGAISSQDVGNYNITISNCNFVRCTSTKYDGNGGAVYLNGDPTYLYNCNFTNCTGNNGVLYFDAANSYVYNCNFIDNNAKYGGAVYFNGKRYGFCSEDDKINFEEKYPKTREYACGA